MLLWLQMKGPGLILAPHLYPPSITRNPQETLTDNQQRWNLSWGLKMQGADQTSAGTPLKKIPVIVGEMGAYDYGDNTKNNTDTTTYTEYDKAWLVRTADYLKALTAASGQGLSWFLWCWNSNSREWVRMALAARRPQPNACVSRCSTALRHGHGMPNTDGTASVETCQLGHPCS